MECRLRGPGLALSASSSAMATGLNAEQGKHFTTLRAETGHSSSGIYPDSQWIKRRQMTLRLLRQERAIAWRLGQKL